MQKDSKILSKRNVSISILIIKMLLLVIVSLIIFLFTKHLSDYAIFSLLLLIPFSVISIDQIIITTNEILIHKYLLFGWLLKKNYININKINSITIKEDLTEIDHPIDVDDEIDYIAPTNTIISNKVEIRYKNESKEEVILVKLKEAEYRLALGLINKTT